MQRNAHILLNAQHEEVLQPASLYHPHPSGDKGCASLQNSRMPSSSPLPTVAMD